MRRHRLLGGMRPWMGRLSLFLAVFAVVAALWPYTIPAYNRVVCAGADLLAGVWEHPRITRITVRGSEAWVYRADRAGRMEPFTYFDSFLYFAIVPLVALLAATPTRGWLRRLLRIPLGLSLLALVHAIYLFASVKLTYVALGLVDVGAVADRWTDWAQIFLRVVWQSAPLLIWLALSVGVLKRWLNRRTAREHG